MISDLVQYYRIGLWSLLDVCMSTIKIVSGGASMYDYILPFKPWYLILASVLDGERIRRLYGVRSLDDFDS